MNIKLTFRNWYAKYFGYTFFGTKEESNAHQKQFEDCWKAAQENK